MNRKNTPDILGSLMGEEIKEENNKAIKHVSSETLETSKEKATFNLSKRVLGDLEDCWIEIRKIRRDKKISKTDIVEKAIEQALTEFNSKKERSNFYLLMKKNPPRQFGLLNEKMKLPEAFDSVLPDELLDSFEN